MERAIVREIVRDGRGGSVERECPRPEAVRQQAARVQTWARGDFEKCFVCSRESVYLRSGRTYCATHRDELRFDIAPRPVRARECRAEPSSRSLHGLAIVFDVWSVDLGGFRERIASQAIDRTLREGQDLRALWSHDPSETLGRLNADTLGVRKERDGLFMALDPPRWADRHVESVSRRDVTGQSFGFETYEDAWHLEDREPRRTVLDMLVSEVSIVSFPAYPQTWVKAGPDSRAFRPSRAFRERVARI